jgi:hypothetical protein
VDGFLWILTEIVAAFVFVSALVHGKSFWSAVKMGVGVIILGLAVIITLGLLGVLVKISITILGMLLWVLVMYAILVFVVRVIRGAA